MVLVLLPWYVRTYTCTYTYTYQKLVVDRVQRRREFVSLVFESSGYVAKLARRYITEWAGRGGRRKGRQEGESKEEGESTASTRARRNLSSAVHYWNVAATILYLRDALLVQLPELTDDGGGVA
jgi:hypothetical protein